jgi:hypothetical protein
MVLAVLGRPMAEELLRVLTDCSPLGTDAFRLVEAARHLGFPASRKYTLASLDDLAIMLARGTFPSCTSTCGRCKGDGVVSITRWW